VRRWSPDPSISVRLGMADDAGSDRSTPNVTSTRSFTSSDRLRELQRLKTEGHLTDEEYESKRSKLLEEL